MFILLLFSRQEIGEPGWAVGRRGKGMRMSRRLGSGEGDTKKEAQGSGLATGEWKGHP